MTPPAIYHRQPWVEDEEAFIRENAHLGDARLAAELGRTAKSVRWKRRELGVRAHRLTRPWEARMRELHAAGLHDTAVAEAAGWPYSTAYARRVRLGLPRNPAPDDAVRSARRARAATRGSRNLGSMLAELRRIKYGFEVPGCKSKAEVEACRLLADRGPMTAAEVAAALGCRTRSYQGEVLAALWRDGMVERRRRPGKGGAIEYRLAARRLAGQRLPVADVGEAS